MYRINGRVGASQADAESRMKLISAIDMIQDCSMFWMESEPSFSDFLDRNGLGMFLLSRQVDVLRLPRYGESIAAETRIFELGGFFGKRNTLLYGEDGAPCILTWSTGPFVSRETGRLVRMPPGEAERIRVDPRVEMEYLGRKVTAPAAPGRAFPPEPVRSGDIDFYGHMNNARYLERGLELLPDGFRVGRLRIDYRMSARAGDMLHPLLTQDADGKRFVLLSDSAGRPYAVMEFTPA